MKDLSVLISGIGIAGPTLAYWLSVYGAKSTLIERSPQLRTGGYVIDFWGKGFDVAERMGLIPAIKNAGYDVKALRIVDSRGRRIGGFRTDAFRSATGGRYVSIARGDLAAILFRAAEAKCPMIFGDCITGMRQDDGGVEVEFEHASSRRFDVVIGADGLHSAVRRLEFGNGNRFEKYLGYRAAAFEVGGYRPRDEDVYVSYSVPGRQAGRFSMRGDRTMFLLVFADERADAADPSDAESQKEIIRRRFGDAGWECPRILEAMESCRELYFDRVSQIRMEQWSRRRVGLLGDAAFCPSLLAGQGSALAMIAACVLAGELCRAGVPPEEAMERYRLRLQSFIADKQRGAEKFAGSFAPKTRWGLFLRNQITKTFAIPLIARRAMGSALIADRFDLPDYNHFDGG